MIIMAVPNIFTSGTLAKSSEVNENFAWTGMVPIGTILPWAKSLTGVPALDDRFVECNGQTLSDAESLLDGQVIPDLNGDNRFLRGSSTSGSTGGSETHNHSRTSGSMFGSDSVYGTNTVNHLPPYYTVVYIMRVK